MVQRDLKVHNHAGIHCRPSSVILNAIKDNHPDAIFTVKLRDGSEHEISGILSLISLGLQSGDILTLYVNGGDEEKALDEIGGLFEKEYDFPIT